MSADEEAALRDEALDALAWLTRVHDSRSSAERLDIVRRYIAALREAGYVHRDDVRDPRPKEKINWQTDHDWPGKQSRDCGGW